MRHNPDFVARQVSDGLVLVPISNATADLDAVFSINSVGARVWELAAELPNENEIAAAICSEFAVEPDVALADVCEFLTQLRGLTAILDD